MSLSAIIFIAFGGAFLIEGAAWAVVPKQIKRAYQMVFENPDRDLHIFGLVNVVIGSVMIGAALKFMT